MRRLLPVLCCLILALAGPATAQPGNPGAARPAAGAQPAPPGANRILAVVNGDVITQAEVNSRARLFALNTGVAASAEALQRLQPQVLRLLVDERLRIQEVQRRRIPVSDQDVAEALAEIEARNGLPRGALVAQMRNAGIQPRVLYDQLRVQIGWGRLLRQVLGPQAEISDAEVQAALAARRAEQNRAEYLVGEIFIPVDDPRQEAEVGRFMEDVLAQLRRGVAFPIVATQFSQAQSAVQGGLLGWVPLSQLDPEVASVVERMPNGAISNPIRVAGGFQIVTVRGRRDGAGQVSGAGPGIATMLSIRQAFLPFETRLDPQAPTEQQRATLERAQRLQATLRGCEQVEALPRAGNRPVDPGPVRLEAVNPPPLRQLLASLPLGRASQPIVSPDGILLIMVCSREQRRMEEGEGASPLSPEAIRQQILRERVEVISRQLLRELRRRGVIELRA
ncbi:MAG: peptidylprolyl isomerase [Roseococcus sp.]|jgi:peptidyl-prolyl cis-trans isomerase SurA